MRRTAEFESLVDAHYAALYRFALSLSRAEPDAADLTQQTFFRWAEKGHQLRDRSKAKTWLFTTLYREFLSRHRHETRFPQVELDESREEMASVSPDLNGLDGTAVLRALGEVDEPFRSCITLFYLKQLSYREIADVLSVPIGTVMSRLSRGKMLLRRRLENPAESEKVVPISKGEEAHG